jgi:hypothetical protein
MRISAFFVLSLLLASIPGEAKEDAWSAWQRELNRACPDNHVDWICDGCIDEFLADFTKTLSSDTQRKIAKIADYSHRCARETAGFYCEMSADLNAFRRLGLLRKFVDYGCRHYKCYEPALCTELDTSPDESK